MEYTPQHPTDSRDWRQNGTNSRLNLEHLQQIDRSAQNTGMGLLYRYFKINVADGAAYYQIVRVKKKTVVVRICIGINLDEYQDAILGEGDEMSLNAADRLVGQRDGLARIFG